MTMTDPVRRPFQVKDPSGKAQWEKVYDQLVPLNRGDVITFDHLREQTGLSLQAVRGGLQKAHAVLQEMNSKTLESVPGVGYRVVEAREHERLGRRHHKKSVRQLKRAQARFRSADRRELTEAETIRMDNLLIIARRHEQSIKNLENRVAAQEKAVETVRNGQAKQGESLSTMTERIEKMRAALVRHNINPD